jgi:hypothetical protein
MFSLVQVSIEYLVGQQHTSSRISVRDEKYACRKVTRYLRGKRSDAAKMAPAG